MEILQDILQDIEKIISTIETDIDKEYIYEILGILEN